MWHWTLGRLALSVLLMTVLYVACIGGLGLDGITGAVAVLGVVLVGAAIVKALR